MPESSRERSRAYPRINLRESVELIEIIRSALGPGPFTRDAVAESMGLSPGSGHANRKSAALVHFGLLDRNGGSYEISELADRLLHPTNDTERSDSIAEAAKSPALYRGLFEKFGGASLPNLLPNILARDYGISVKQSKDVAQTFRESAEYANLLRHGILHKELGFNAAVETREEHRDHAPPTQESGTAVFFKPSGKSQVSPTNLEASLRQYAIPMRGGQSAMLCLPASVSQKDLDRIKQWIELMGEALVDEIEVSGD